MTNISNKDDPRKLPLCIICAKPQELATIAGQLGLRKTVAGDSIPAVNKAHTFYPGCFRSGDGDELPFYLTSCSRQGIQTFAVEATALFLTLKPKYAIHAGCCAGRDGKGIELGNVIFGQTALNYEEGKNVPKDGKLIFQPSSETISSEDKTVAGFVAGRNGSGYHFGGFASGCSVRLDAQDVLERLEVNVNREIVALEMEASAFLYVCKMTNVESLGVIKGVSDLGDKNKGEGNDKYLHKALCNTADAIKDWVQFRLKAHSLPPHEREPGVLQADSYYNSYVKQVMKLKKNVWTRSGAVEGSIHGLKVVLPLESNPMHYGNDEGLIDKAIDDYDLKCACVGDAHLVKTTLYKSGYLIDFPRNIQYLAKYPDSDHQIELFEREITGRCSAWQGSVEVMTWERFELWAKRNIAASES